MNVRMILHSPNRAAAAVAVAGLLFAACGTASGFEATHPDTTRPTRDIPVTSAADADTLWQYLATLAPAERNQAIIALNPNVSGALEAIVVGMVASANTH
jgi:hypothetical protein